MPKTLTIEGKISNLDGIMFCKRWDYRGNKEYAEAMFYTDAPPELWERIRSSGIDQCKPARVTIVVEQEDG